MSKKNSEKEQNLEKTQQLDIEKVNEEIDAKTKEMDTKKEKKEDVKSKEEVENKDLKEQKKEDIIKDFTQQNLTLSEVVSKINAEKGQVRNQPVPKKQSPLLSVIFIVLVIILLWSAVYYLFLSPNAVLKNMFDSNEVEKTDTDKTNIQTTEEDIEIDEALIATAEISAQNFVDAAYLWYTEAFLRYNGMTDVKVNSDGSIVKLNPDDSFVLNEGETLSLNGDTPTNINSMIISKEGIIAISRLQISGYCFDYDGENLTNVNCGE